MKRLHNLKNISNEYDTFNYVKFYNYSGKKHYSYTLSNFNFNLLYCIKRNMFLLQIDFNLIGYII